jgi:hypothetical protein
MSTPQLLLSPRKFRKTGTTTFAAMSSSALSSPTDPTTAELPGPTLIRQLAHSAWRGVETKSYGTHRGNKAPLFKGRNLVQWLLYHNGYPDTKEYRAYVMKLAQAFIDKRYVVRITSPLRLFGWLRKKRVNTTFSDDKYLYDFNHVAVSNMHIVVLVHAAENLIAADRNGFSDPMCRISLGTRQSAKTRIIFNKTSPVWNEVFTFGVEDLESQQLIFEVVDYDLGKQADFLGYARLPLRNIVNEKVLMSKKLAAEQLQRWVAVASPGASMLRGSKKFRRDEVAASSAFLSEGGHMNDVDLLFGDGTQHFSGAMHTLVLGPGPTHSRKNVRGTLRVGAFLRQFNPDDVKIRDEYGDISEESEDASTQKYQLYCQILHARDIETKGHVTMIGDYVPLLRWMNRVRLMSNGEKKYTSWVSLLFLAHFVRYCLHF